MLRTSLDTLVRIVSRRSRSLVLATLPLLGLLLPGAPAHADRAPRAPAPDAFGTGFVIEWPLGLAARDGSLYVADFHGGRVWKLSSEGVPLKSWTGAAESPFRNPSGVAVDVLGNVYVADFAGDVVQRLAADGSPVVRFGSWGHAPGQLRGPFGVAVSDEGDVYVTDLDNQRVQRFTSGGAFVSAWGSAGREPGQFADPMGIAVDALGHVLVADHGNHRIQVFTRDGRFLEAFGALDDVDPFLFGPVGVAAGADGTVYVTDLINHMVQKIGTDRAFVTQWNEEQTMAPPMGTMYGVAVEGQHVYVADPHGHRVTRFKDESPARLQRGSGVARFALSLARPNPTTGSTTITLALPSRSRVSGHVFDVHGRRVRALVDGVLEAGVHPLVWDGRDDGGRPEPAGLYFVRARRDGEARALEARVAIVR